MAVERDQHESVHMQQQEDDARKVTRRGFLTGIGAGAAGAAGSAALHPTEVFAQHSDPSLTAARSDRFTRIFQNLRPFAEATPNVTRALVDLGAPLGLLDARDDLS